MHILVVHAMVILLTLGPPRGEQPEGAAGVGAAAPGLPAGSLLYLEEPAHLAGAEWKGPALMGVPWSGRHGESSPCLSRGFWGGFTAAPHCQTTGGQAVTLTGLWL